MSVSTLLHSERLSDRGVLFLCSQSQPAVLTRLLKGLNGRKVVLLTETDAVLGAEMRQAVGSSGLPRLIRTEMSSHAAVPQAVAAGAAVIAVTPAVASLRATNVRVPHAVIEDLCGFGVPVQPIGVDLPQEHCLSVESPGSFPEVVLCVMPVIPAGRAAHPLVQAALIEGAAEAYATRATFGEHLGRLLVAGLKKHAAGAVLHDGLDGSEMSFARLFAAAACLAGVIRKETKESRVGIVLPPGRAGMIANLAVVLAGKVPVNLNFTAGKDAIESAIRQSGIDRFVTVDQIVRKVQTFPWPSTRDIIFVERLLPRMKMGILKWELLLRLLPVPALCSLLKLPSAGGDAEAALLFTSGSSGEPKGVVLTHRNLISNVTQFAARLDLKETSKLLGCLPLFHSFGCTVTLWYPLIEGLSLVTYPTPLEPPKLAELIEKHGVELLLATPTFLRGYLRRVKVEQLATLKYVVTGAEKLPLNLEEEFRRKFGKPVMEGYGLTETSPVTNVNLPDPASNGKLPVLASRRLGSTGQLMPGLAVRITDAITGDALPVDRSGIIWMKGPNVFTGYLKQPRKTEEVLRDGWFSTGDVGRLDADGFLHIEGRLSRFSKIGGEMVPHETVEDYIIRALELESDSERRIAVVGVPDPDKGEALVLLSTVAGETVKQELIQLRYTLLEQGVPSLWIPRRLVPVAQIPILASGKLDIKACEKLATSAAG
ncbi:MAG: acyl-[acyl-carrier-protein]-phospholipid O-acyltransferase / LCFA-[acyl-carrier-protein] ligase [Verrucomicrobia bacterium]|nr:MAG: acyl-[acyl-carrier-protein]-phospholipid O-acyltransferase / LCFA-[acyl-carrier-protein] ligase [Verrucomicrobiota bacterium]